VLDATSILPLGYGIYFRYTLPKYSSYKGKVKKLQTNSFLNTFKKTKEMNLSTKHSEQKSSLRIGSVGTGRIFLQGCGVIAFRLRSGCGIWAGSV
jgi:hypothetical protein